MLIDSEILSSVSQKYKSGVSVSSIVSELTEKGYSQGEILNILELTESHPQPYSPDYRAINRRTVHANFTPIPAEGVQFYIYDTFLAPDFCVQFTNDICPRIISAFSDPSVGSSTLETLDPALFSEVIEIDRNLDLLLRTYAKMPPACSEFMRLDAYGMYDKEPTTYILQPESANLAATERLNPRTWSFFVFLNDNVSGGEITFPKIDLVVAPSTGFALLWNRLDENGRPVDKVMSEEAPVLNGTRYVLRKDYRTFPIC